MSKKKRNRGTNTPVTPVQSTPQPKKNIIEVVYDDNTLETLISVNGKAFDTSRINGKEIADWAYPFMMRKVRWNGFYDEMVQALGGQKAFDLVFEGSDEALAELREAWENAPVNVVSGSSTENVVVIVYDENTLTTEITVNGQPFDTSRINGKEIADWVYPFMMRKIKWEGIFEELAKVVGSQDYTIQFSGSNSAMNELMEECPETVAISKKKTNNGSSIRHSSDSSSNISTNSQKCHRDFSSYSLKELIEMIDDAWSGYNDTFSASDKQEILSIITEYAEKDEPDAQYMLGRMYTSYEWVAEKDDEAANDWYRRAIHNYDVKRNKSNWEIQYKIASAYYYGDGVEKDENRAVSIYRRIAESQTVFAELACYQIADYYEFACDDENEAEKWNEKAKKILKQLANNSSDPEIIEKYAYKVSETEAFKWHEKAANKGLAEAMSSVADCYAAGTGVSHNEKLAIEWYKKAIEHGYIGSYYSIGQNYDDEGNFRTDYRLAKEWYEKGAEKGLLMALEALGDMFFYGKGVQQDYSKAFNYYNQAHNYSSFGKLALCYYYGYGTKKDYYKAVEYLERAGEYVDNAYLLGNCYYYGYGTEKDWDKAFSIYNEAMYQFNDIDTYLEEAKKGNAVMQCVVGCCYRSRSYGSTELGDEDYCYHEAEKWLKKSVAGGFEQAETELAEFYKYFSEDNEAAFDIYLEQAEKGDADAQLYVGICYEEGKGVECDEYEAFRWYMASAEQDNMYAQWRVGSCYENGTGVEVDFDEAFEWYMKSANNGYALAQADVGRFYYNGFSPDVDYDEAVSYFMMASEESAEAQFFLGECYYVGCGVEADYEKAEMWYRKSADGDYAPALYHVAENNEDEYEAFEQYMNAAEQGYSLAIIAVADCYYMGKGVEENIYEAIEWYEKAAEYGEAKAICQLGVFYLDGIGYDKDEYKAVEYFEEAYYNNNDRYSTAGIWLGLAYYFGWGNLSVNYNEAFKLFEEYHEKYGEEQATYWLAECYRLGRGTYRDRNKALELFQELVDSTDQELGDSASKMCESIRKNADKDDQMKKVFFSGAKRIGAEALRMTGLPFSSIIASIIDEL